MRRPQKLAFRPHTESPLRNWIVVTPSAIADSEHTITAPRPDIDPAHRLAGFLRLPRHERLSRH